MITYFFNIIMLRDKSLQINMNKYVNNFRLNVVPNNYCISSNKINASFTKFGCNYTTQNEL